jgi:hypothetical protein
MSAVIDFRDDDRTANIDKSLNKNKLINSPANLPNKSDADYGNKKLKKCREYIGEESRESGWWAGMPFIDRMALIRASGIHSRYQDMRSAAESDWQHLSQSWKRGVLISVRRMCQWAKQKSI